MDASHEGRLFGLWLRRRRKSLDLTQKELARLVGCSLHTIRKLESGARRPSKPVAGAIARATGIPKAEHAAFVRYARTGRPGSANDARRPDRERPWLPAPATEGDPAGREGAPAASAPAAAVAGPVDPSGTARANGSRASPPFLGRKAELGRLQEGLNDALQGRGRVMLIAGEAGQGKTSLMMAFAERAQAAHPGLLTVIGACNAYTGSGDPFAPFREIFAQLTGHVPHGADRRFDATRRARLRAFLPQSLASLLDNGPDLLDALVPIGPLRSRLSEAGIALPGRLAVSRNSTPADLFPAPETRPMRAEAVAVLADIADEVPLLVLLDDLQWADESSLEVLLQLARAAAAHQLLVVAAYRPGELAPPDDGSSPPIRRVLHDLARQFGEAQVDLDRADARAFLDAWIDSEPNDLGPTFREALWRQTRGQPLFTIELLRTMQQRGDLILDAAGRWAEGPDLHWDALPARVAGALAQRVARLDATAQKLLTVASVEGEVFNLEVVARVLDIDPLEAAQVASRVLERQHRLVELAEVTRLEDGQRLSRYRFRHNLIQRYVLEQLGEAERIYLHEKIASATEALLGEDADPLALALHYSEAQAPASAAPFWRMAGDRARRAGAFTDAIRAYRDALDAWPEDDHEGRAELLFSLGDCLVHHGEEPDGLRALEASLTEYDRLGDRSSPGAVGAAIVRVGLTTPIGARRAEALEAWLPTLEKAPESHVLGTALDFLSFLYAHQDDARALAFARRGLEMAGGPENDRRRTRGLIALGWVLALTGAEGQDEALTTLRQGIALAERIGAVSFVGLGLLRLGQAQESFGRVDGAAETFRNATEHCRRHQLEAIERQVRALYFRLLWSRGRWSESATLLPQLRAETDRPHARALVLAAAELDLGRPAAARPWLDDLQATMGPGYWLLLRVPSRRELLRGAAARGDLPGAERHLADLLDTVGERPSYPSTAIEPLVTAARWLAHEPGEDAGGRIAFCIRALERIERQYGSRHARAGLAAARAARAESDGDTAAAADAYLRAAGIWAEEGFPLFEARARYAAAHLLRRMGSAAQGERELALADKRLANLQAQLQDAEAALSFAAARRRLREAPQEPLL